MEESPPVTHHVAQRQATLHSAVVAEVQTAIAAHDVVVVGMQFNPHVARARKALNTAGVNHHYLEFGGYLSMWRPRLAIKLWSRWPTFPQVFVKGTLVGGADQVQHMLADGSLQVLLEGPAA